MWSTFMSNAKPCDTERETNRDFRVFTFRQNNSGGYFIGPSEFVITARSYDEAKRTLESQSWYDPSFCECCGPRWFMFVEENFI